MKESKLQLGILIGGMFFVTLGFSIIMPILPYYTHNMGASALDLGLLMASYSFMQLIVTPFWGVLSDRFGRKPIFLIGLFGFGLSFIIYGFATQLWMLFAGRMIGGILAGSVYPTSLAYIADITEHRERGRIMGTLGAASGVGMIFGPSVAGILSIWGLSVPFFVTAAAAIVFAVVGFLVLEESHSVDVHRMKFESPSLIAPLKTPIAILFVLNMLVTFIISGLQGTFAYYILGRFGMQDSPSPMPFLAGSVLLTGPTAMAILFTIMGIVGVVCQGVLVGVFIDRIGEPRTILLGMSLSAVSLLLILVSPELVSLLLFSSLTVVGTGLCTPCLNSLVSKATDEEHQGKAMGVLGSFGSMGRIIGPPMGGFAYDISINLPYMIMATISAMGAVTVFTKRKTLRKIK
jgi:MFS transporter, DHA1 family, multidrug resistance protein